MSSGTPSCTFSAPLAGGTIVVSPSSKLLAIVAGSRITVRDASSLVVVAIYPCIDKVDKCSFSPDSGYVLCAMLPRAAVQVFSIADPEWKCRINEGLAGLVNAYWTPDSRSVVTESDYGIQLSIWSLVNSTSHVISAPKQNPNTSIASGGNGLVTSNAAANLSAFSDCGKYFAVVHRIDLGDHIGVYSTAPWQELTKFKCRSNDVSQIFWTPHGAHIVTIDSPLNYKMCAYSPSGEVLANFEAYSSALGIRSLAFYRPPVFALTSVFNSLSSASHGSNLDGDTITHSSIENKGLYSSISTPATQLMAVGSYDGKIRLISMTSWTPALLLPLTHPRDMDAGVMSPNDASSFLCTVEVCDEAMPPQSASHTGKAKQSSSPVTTYFVTKILKALPRNIPDIRDPKFLPQMGNNWIGWSADGSLIAAREESYPRCIWIWESLSAKLVALLVQLEPVLSAAWRPAVLESPNSLESDQLGAKSLSTSPLLTFVTGSNRLYFWSPTTGVSYAEIPLAPVSNSPTLTAITNIQWDHLGQRIILNGKESFCTCELETQN